VDKDTKLSEIFHVEPSQLYQDWLSSAGHSALTGSPANIEPNTGSRFSAWDGYIWGVTLELEPDQRIVQSWRTTEFPAEAPDSRLELKFEPVNGGTRLTIHHSNIPDGQADGYEEGWRDFYFKPMREYYR
jgi:activator of HSP90 ATPase